MTGQIIAMILLTPFALAFIYAGIHEYLRHRSRDGASYGLVYDEETGTTHISGIAENEEAYNPDEFDPNDHNRLEGADDDGL
ncbi:hypothetical protein ACEWPM_005140 [Roseovarius sp. S4756]|uniref:hypothetical protein n=1 Tax=Roseovarius maritimus TaxID=3342637 RepID=UPI003727E192